MRSPAAHRRRSPSVRAEQDRRLLRCHAPAVGIDPVLLGRLVAGKVHPADLHDATLQTLAPAAEDRPSAIRAAVALVGRIRRSLKTLLPPADYGTPRPRRRGEKTTNPALPWPFDGPSPVESRALRPQRAALARSASDGDPDPPARLLVAGAVA